MDDVESEPRISRKKRKLTTGQGVVIGVATVAGLGLVTKLFSFLRRDNSKKLNEADLETLEAVLSGDAAKSPLPLQAQVALSTPKFANLEEDDAPDHKDVADSSPEPTPETDATQEYATADVDANTKETPHLNGEANGVQHHTEEDEADGKHDNEDAAELRIENGGEHIHSEDAAKIIPGDDEVKQPLEDADVAEPHLENMELHLSEDAAAVEAHTNDVEEPRSDDAKQLPIGDAGKLSAEDVEKLSIEDEGEHRSQDIAVEAHSVDDVKLHSEDAEKGSNKQPNGDALNLVTEDVGKHPSEDAVEHQINDVENLVTEDEGTHPSEDAAEPQIHDAQNLVTEDLGKHPSEDAAEPQVIRVAENLVTEDKEKHGPSEDAVEPQDAEKPSIEDEGIKHQSENSVEPHNLDDGKHLTEDAEKLQL